MPCPALPQRATSTTARLQSEDVSAPLPVQALGNAEDVQWLDDHRLVLVMGSCRTRRALYIHDTRRIVCAPPQLLDVDVPQCDGTAVLAVSAESKKIAVGVGAEVCCMWLEGPPSPKGIGTRVQCMSGITA